MNLQEGSVIEDASARGRQPVVLQVLPALVTGGVERGTVDMAAAIAEAGWTSLVASAGGPMVRELERVGARHIQMPLESRSPFAIRRNAGYIARVIREFGVDIVHARSRAPAWSAHRACARTGCHFVTTFHGTYNPGPFGIKKRYNAIMTRGERVIAISHFISEHMQRLYHVDPDKIRVIHRGVDLDRFDPGRVSAERLIQLARQWRLPDGAPVIMLPGRLTRWKGQSVLIEALALLGRRDIRCLLVGADQGRTKYRGELEKLISRRGLGDVVHIVDQCNDMPAAYKLTDVAISASTDPEAFGRVIVEAMAMGRPVIGSNHGGAAETIVDGETGWLVPPGDPEALAQMLDWVLGLAAPQRQWVADTAMRYVRAHFTKDLMCRETLAVYGEVLDAGNRPHERLRRLSQTSGAST